MEHFTHIDDKGNAVMVDVSGKAVTARTATAAGRIVMSRECYEAVTAGDIAKGDVLGIDRFGESAPAGVLWPYFGFTVDNGVARVEKLLP